MYLGAIPPVAGRLYIVIWPIKVNHWSSTQSHAVPPLLFESISLPRSLAESQRTTIIKEKYDTSQQAVQQQQLEKHAA
jgi:hypothetical protein